MQKHHEGLLQSNKEHYKDKFKVSKNFIKDYYKVLPKQEYHYGQICVTKKVSKNINKDYSNVSKIISMENDRVIIKNIINLTNNISIDI